MTKWLRPLSLSLCLLVAVFLAGCSSPEQKYDKYLQRGDSYFAKHDYVRARLEYRNAAKIQPADPRAIYNLGLVEEAEGNLQPAISAFSLAEQQAPDYVPVLLKLSQFYLTVKNQEEARRRIWKVLEVSPQNARAHALLGSLYLSEKDIQHAQEETDAAFSHDKTDMVAFSVQSGIHMAKGESDKALEVLQAAIAMHREEISFYLLMATIYSEKGDMAGVEKIYRDIFKLFPDQIRFRFDLAKILSETGKTEQADALYRETAKLFPEALEAKFNLFQFLEQQKGATVAEEEIKAFIEGKPDQKIFYLWLADMYVRHGQNDQAIAALERILGTESDDSLGMNATTFLANIQLQKGDAALAKKLIETVLESDINNTEAIILRSNLAFLQGDLESALSDLRTVLRNTPESLKAAKALTEVLVMQGRLDLALDTLLQAVQYHPNDESVLVRLAQLYSLRGNAKKAEEILTLVTAKSPSYAPGWETLARFAMEQKNWSLATEATQKLESLDGQAAVALFLKGRIQQLSGDTQQAIAIYREVIVADPSSRLASYALSALLETVTKKEDLEEARALLAGLKTSNSAIQTVLGSIEATLGHKEEAETAFRKALQPPPAHQAPYIVLAEFLMAQNRADDALTILETAEREVPIEAKASLMRADLLSKKGQIDAAIEVYERALPHAIDANIPANNIAQLIADYKYQDKEALEKARMLAERFINSSNPYYLDTLGWVYYRAGLTTQAQTYVSKAITLLKSPNAQVDYHYGAILLALGQKEDAKVYLLRATSSSGYAGDAEAKRLLEK